MWTKNKAGSDLANHRSDCRTLSVYGQTEQLLRPNRAASPSLQTTDLEPLESNLFQITLPAGGRGGGEEEEIYTGMSLIFGQVPLPQWVLELLEKRENTGSQSSLRTTILKFQSANIEATVLPHQPTRACLSMMCKSLPRLIFNLLLPHLSFPSSSSLYLPATAFMTSVFPQPGTQAFTLTMTSFPDCFPRCKNGPIVRKGRGMHKLPPWATHLIIFIPAQFADSDHSCGLNDYHYSVYSFFPHQQWPHLFFLVKQKKKSAGHFGPGPTVTHLTPKSGLFFIHTLRHFYIYSRRALETKMECVSWVSNAINITKSPLGVARK